jgi:ribosomal protein L37AE/L43A
MQTLIRTYQPLKVRPQTGYIPNYPRKQPQKTLEQPVCPCCASPLLRHVRRSGIYWRCSHCHQEMPALSTLIH